MPNHEKWVTHELFIHHTCWCPKIPLKKSSWKPFLNVWKRENWKLSKNLLSIHVCNLRHICFEGKLVLSLTRSNFFTGGNHVNSVPGLAASPETFYVFRRIESENSWKWNKFKTAMYLPLSSFPVSLPQNTAYFAFFLDFSHLFSDSDHFFGFLGPSYILPSCNACCLPYSDKNAWKNQCFDSTLGKSEYKALEWEAKFVWVMRGVSSDIDYFYNLCATLLRVVHALWWS